MPLGMIYFIVGDSKYDDTHRVNFVRFLMACTILLHCLFDASLCYAMHISTSIMQLDYQYNIKGGNIYHF